ncbi:alpha/beta fold hydrolase [uncultured Corynebacterium sp.]|uniref:alpha/beta fold hydrolase n=1 Tax=uncultured Corynebacterium sp. TaxID=159447 RepID=UPI0025E0A23C|nr:alpha/beta fold hydrolase [uncultured Corynebacterium sp.]
MMKPLLLRWPPQGSLPDGVLDVGAAGAVRATGATGDSVDADSSAGPPVICLHGTVANGGNWGKLAAIMLDQGRTVVAPTYGDRGTAALLDNLTEITAITRRTLEITGAPHVDVVGHSQGGLLAGLMVAEMLGETVGTGPPLPPGSIRKVVCISGSHRGVRVPALVPIAAIRATFGPALADQITLRRSQLDEGRSPAVVQAAQATATADSEKYPLPDWFDLITDADRIVPADCALSTDEYPGARTIRLEDRLGRGVPHHRQPHDGGVAKLISELLAP